LASPRSPSSPLLLWHPLVATGTTRWLDSLLRIVAILAFVQARMGSMRLPGKVLSPLGGQPSLLRIVDRLSRVEALDGIAVLTSLAPGDDEIAALCASKAVVCIRGDEHDVLGRFSLAAKQLKPDLVLRVTADCPLVDPEVVADLLDLYASRPEIAYASVATGAIGGEAGLRRFPDGLDAEVVATAALEQAWRESRDPYEREHVTPFVSRRPERFPSAILECERDLGTERWTIDHPADLELVRAVYKRLSEPFGWRDVLALLDRDPTLRRLNVAHRAQPT
jgi:spore coat polysaccharide biosynthesis protein SpsF